VSSEEWLERARAAAASGDALAMLEALHRSFALDGLMRRLAQKWSDFAVEDVEDLVAAATDALYEAVNAGGHVANLVAFLWKVADRRASDLHQARQRQVQADLEVMEREGRLITSPSGDGPTGPAILDEVDPDEARAWAVATARTFVDRLGHATVQRVMGFVIDAVEAGRWDVSNREVADALGLSAGTVRTSLSRGFRRLVRIAADAGITELVVALQELGVGLDEEEE
jgi:DNA-directed RNA polymerase specialized sigma24 family protein